MTPAIAPEPTFAQLEQVALQILRLIRDIPGLEGTKLAVVGDLAVCHYLPQHGRPASIDFVVSRSSSPGRVRKEIASHPMSPLFEKSGAVFFPLANRQEVEVKLIPDWLCPYLPAAARPVRDGIDALPYVSIEDLLVFKVDACGLRERESSKRQEARDAAALLELAAKHTPLKLQESKLEKIEQALEEVVEYSAPDHDKSWWQRSLGQVPDKQRLASEIFSDLADSSSTCAQPTSPAHSSKASSIYSTMSRTSSSVSTMSGYSASSSMPSTPTQEDRLPEKNGRPRKMSATNKTPRHNRHRSNGGSSNTLHVSGMQRLDIGRPESPGVALCNLC